MQEIKELATLKDIPILKAGTHRSRNAGAVVITESEIDEYIEGGNALKGLVKEAMSTGEYAGNPHIKKGFVPGALNLHHNDFLGETLKNRTKDVDWSYGKQEIDGELWLTETLTNVPHDVAQAVKQEYPFRSVEILPNVKDPNTGKTYKGVLRSTAFLNRYTPPAVKGQSEHITVEFSEGESPVMVLYSSIEPNNTMEVNDMANEKQNAMPDTGKQENQTAELAEKLSEKDALIAELQAQKQAEAAELAALRAEKDNQSAAIAELQAAQDQAEVREFMTGFEKQLLPGEQGEKYTLSPSFVGIAKELIAGTGKGAVIEMSEGQKPAREVLQKSLQAVAELAAKDGLVACLSNVGDVPNEDPDAKPVDTTDRVKQLMEEKGIEHLDAWKMAEKEKEVA